MDWEVLGVVRVFFIFLKVQLSQQLAGLGHTVIHSPILQDALGSNLEQNSVSPRQAHKDARAGCQRDVPLSLTPPSHGVHN